MSLKQCHILLVAGLMLPATMVWSEDGPTPQREVLVSASRIPAQVGGSAVDSWSITREQIESLALTSVVDLLRIVPGLHVDEPGASGGVSSIYLRGADPNYTLVLVDGLPLNDPTNSRGGSFDISTMDLLSIDRVEVLRGPQSALYGSDAIAGVINFITLGGTDRPKHSVYTRLGSAGGDTKAVLLQGPLGAKGNFAIGGTHLDDGERLEGSSFENSVVNAKANLEITDDDLLTISLRASGSDGTAFPDDSGGPRFAKIRLVDSRQATELSARLYYVGKISNVWRYTVGSSSYRRRELFESPGVAPGVRSAAGIPRNSSETTFESVGLSFTTGYDWKDELNTVVGVEFEREFGKSNGSLSLGGTPLDTRFFLKRSALGWFGESRWKAGPSWFINGSARLDLLDTHNSIKSFSIGTIYDIAATDTTIRASWGNGFKLPSFYALGNDLVGDPNLQPELSRSFDLTLDQDLYDGMSTVGLSLFKNRYQNTIDFDGSINKLVNRSIISTWGGEVDISFRYFSDLVLGAHISHAHTNIRGTNEKLKNRVKWKGGMNAAWVFDKHSSMSLSLLRVGQVLSSSIPTGDRILGAYTTIDITVNWLPNDFWKMTGSIDNLFGADVREGVGFAIRGPIARISIRYQY